jgi:hypothetical protein
MPIITCMDFILKTIMRVAGVNREAALDILYGRNTAGYDHLDLASIFKFATESLTHEIDAIFYYFEFLNQALKLAVVVLNPFQCFILDEKFNPGLIPENRFALLTQAIRPAMRGPNMAGLTLNRKKQDFIHLNLLSIEYRLDPDE